ncbi:NADH dehydrogenase I iron-sulfur protein 13kDa subunit [Cyanidioschyzon merolae strain 10D]|jgi:uncharacterized Zn-finger protein|uniref:NADH dehydrogenase I iron-sulfur protein 13kDa subunit n=1 Tax=Cyanidioschyzon merolae (strain NIES-3377 / 10D) TaxID=280699 RepID=M1V9C7_CYAM1|nr:NADH dehydrogenase I iron-sulfur protein 13kDa subunit [Cyanidioschyzon merolae strain 10D]BAM81389.1 NADH dehydrogenase I iron-sulfur protein 13kDa subunit [Cyanidioschyzon merolae strain 10D]|eukprot:XP_005537425.1 NADH dehydrogenase I iron-sulfur protein 13kDa subunit [Cyanidioschyzon merolae strain 10D]
MWRTVLVRGSTGALVWRAVTPSLPGLVPSTPHLTTPLPLLGRSFATDALALKDGLIRYRMHYPDGQVPPKVDRNLVRSKWHSDAMELIEQVPPLVVEREVIACNGGPNVAMGHPIEYIRVDAADPAPSVCKYCGLRYIHRHAATAEAGSEHP